MNGPIDAASAHQRGVGRVDDGIGILPGDVALHENQRGALAEVDFVKVVHEKF